MRFPSISARDLEGRDYRLPDDLPPGHRIVLLAFQRWQQTLIGTWTPVLAQLSDADPELSVWEVPTLSRVYLAGRFYIDGGMRAGITDHDARQHTLTAYTDVAAVARALELPTLDTIYVLLVDDTGEVVWRAAGEATVEAYQELRAALGLR